MLKILGVFVLFEYDFWRNNSAFDCFVGRVE